MEKKTAHIPHKLYEEKIVRKYRNYKLLLYTCLGGIGLLFITLSFSYFTHQRLSTQKPLPLHPIFIINTSILLFSSLVLEISKIYFQRDQWKAFKRMHVVFIGLGLLFLAGQVSGWYMLSQQGFGLKHHSAAYLFLISGFHGLHLAGGLVFYAYFVMYGWKFLRDYTTAVVYFTDPVAKSQLNLFSLYWHFLGITWMYLLLFFVIVR